MRSIKSGQASLFLENGGGAELLFGGLFSAGCKGVNLEFSWGDIPSGATDVMVSVRMRRVEAPAAAASVGDFALGSYGSNVDMSDKNIRAWADYFSDMNDGTSADDRCIDANRGLQSPSVAMSLPFSESCDSLYSDDDFCETPDVSLDFEEDDTIRSDVRDDDFV